MKRFPLLLLLALLLGGCVPTVAELRSADYGPPPEQHHQLFVAAISAALKDPYSAHYQVAPPSHGWRRLSGGIEYGWYVCGLVNAKNSYGGYVGYTPAWIFVRSGQVRTYSLDKYMGVCPTG